MSMLNRLNKNKLDKPKNVVKVHKIAEVFCVRFRRNFILSHFHKWRKVAKSNIIIFNVVYQIVSYTSVS